MPKKKIFRKNVVEKLWSVGYRNEYGEDEVTVVRAESETGAMMKVGKEFEIVSVEEYSE